MSTHSKKDEHVFCYCNVSFATHIGLEDHKRNCKNHPILYCERCNRKFTFYIFYTLYTGAATLCLPCATTILTRSQLKAQTRPWSFNGGTHDAQTSPWTPWSPWSFEHVQNGHTNVAEEVSHSQVAQRRQEESTWITVVAECMHSGRPLVAP